MPLGAAAKIKKKKKKKDAQTKDLGMLRS